MRIEQKKPTLTSRYKNVTDFFFSWLIIREKNGYILICFPEQKTSVVAYVINLVLKRQVSYRYPQKQIISNDCRQQTNQ